MLTFFILFFNRKIYRHYTYWNRQGVINTPYPKFKWLFKPFHEFIAEIAAIDPSVKISAGFVLIQKVLVLNDPKIAHDLSVKEGHKYPFRSNAFLGTNSLAKSLFFLEANHDWKRIRTIVSPSFTSGKLKAMSEPISEIADQLVNNLRSHAKDGKPFDIKLYFDGFTMDVIARCAYGIQLDSVSQPDHPIIGNAKNILNTDMDLKKTICVFFPKIAEFLNFHFFDPKAVNYFDTLTKTIIEKRKTSGKRKFILASSFHVLMF